jgi:hypothetical protein
MTITETTARFRVIQPGTMLYRDRRLRRTDRLLIVAMVEVLLSTFRTGVLTAAVLRGRRATVGFLYGERRYQLPVTRRD